MFSANRSEESITEQPSPVLSVNTKPRGEQRITNMDLNILFKFVKPYNGCRETLNSFVINCDNAYILATREQEPILFKYILCQLEGKAEIACSIKDFDNWLQLKEFLKNQFCERKHHSHLLSDLQESKQSPLETVAQYALKVETCLSQLLTEISITTPCRAELTGRIAAMEDLALHHFTMGLLPRISTIVRCRSPQALNEAINLAISEERIQQSMYRRPQPTEYKGNNNVKNLSPPVQPRSNFAQKSMNFQNRNYQSDNSNSRPQIVCRYCKNIGHIIENCRKREYNNNRSHNFQLQQPNRNINSSSRPSPGRIHYVHEENTESRDEVDSVSGNENLRNSLNE